MFHASLLVIGGLLTQVPGGGSSLPARAGGTDGQSWELSSVPALEIHPSSNDGQTPWGSVATLTRLQSGQVVVGDGMKREILFYDPSGQYERTVGRSGEGPGEFRLVGTTLQCNGDSVFVWDPAKRRVTVFDSRTSSMRDFGDEAIRMEVAGSPPLHLSKVTCNAGGLFATTSQRTDQLPRNEGPTEMDVRVDIIREGKAGTTLGWFSGDELYFADGTLFPRPLGRRNIVAIGSDRVFVGTTDKHDVAVFSMQGERVGTIRGDQERVRMSNDAIDAYAESRGGSSSFWTDLEYPDFLPAYSSLLVDPENNLWVEEFPDPFQTHAVWRVYDVDGNLHTTLVMPEGFELFEVGRDYALGVRKDQFDVESVLVYHLVK